MVLSKPYHHPQKFVVRFVSYLLSIQGIDSRTLPQSLVHSLSEGYSTKSKLELVSANVDIRNCCNPS